MMGLPTQSPMYLMMKFRKHVMSVVVMVQLDVIIVMEMVEQNALIVMEMED